MYTLVYTYKRTRIYVYTHVYTYKRTSVYANIHMGPSIEQSSSTATSMAAESGCPNLQAVVYVHTYVYTKLHQSSRFTKVNKTCERTIALNDVDMASRPRALCGAFALHVGAST